MGKKSQFKGTKRPRDQPRVQDDELDSGDEISTFIESQQLTKEMMEVDKASRKAAKKAAKKVHLAHLSAKEEAREAAAARIKNKGTNDDDDDDNDDDQDDEDAALEDMDEEERAEYNAYMKLMEEKGEAVAENPRAPKTFANNQKGLLQKLRDISLEKPGRLLPWSEVQAITTKEPLVLTPSDIHDDIKRELEFYKQALYAATQGRAKAIEAGIPFSRPDDYFAEMLKTDAHMAKVRQKLIDEQESIVAAENAKKQREAKKFGKKVQHEKLLERVQAKNNEIERVKMARKKKDSMGVADDDFGIELEDSDTKGSSGARAGSKVNAKRQKKNEKYGFGGGKRHKKENTRDSVNDFRSFSVKKMKGSIKKSTGKGGAAKRPGKARRQQSRK
ncbi:eukaryotic rRNA processing protein EBP2-domain-containing protein [Polychytrium aggregatum]|uniref:eukaryotic rRNA processing protein EBP2-domain-containing protein n=1 Tax=Polychytrium aggregatum TaxID=110093 RepID=UPI0022FDE55E|nr:eukaryotic rRNA processing protein EBP2-domain-containing protein [Polychytrium aggregatum]KAI9208616.1 eukaryotic rRNA processing protein EBP2-domain-containing protein [Polychytrium aggregatum]